MRAGFPAGRAAIQKGSEAIQERAMENQKHEDHKYDPPAGCFLRLFWMLIGNLILLFCAYSITQNRSSFFSVADAFYWAAVGCLLAVRYADIRYLKGLTADGDPASMAHWRRYAGLVLIASTCLWLVVHAVAVLYQPAA